MNLLILIRSGLAHVRVRR